MSARHEYVQMELHLLDGRHILWPFCYIALPGYRDTPGGVVAIYKDGFEDFYPWTSIGSAKWPNLPPEPPEPPEPPSPPEEPHV
jgi:hypothetical protein